MFGFEGKTLRSERLEYRLIDERDRGALRRIVSDGSVTEPAGFAPIKDEADFEDFFAGLRQANCGAAILLDGKAIGYVRAFMEDMDDIEGREKASAQRCSASSRPA